MTRHATLLWAALDLHERLLEAQSDLMLAIHPQAFDPFDQELCDAVATFVHESADACRMLPSRSRRARLNMRWMDFLQAQRARRPIPPLN
jgi:hypothetical protein